MLIKQLLRRNWALYSPPESPPLAHQDPAALRLPLVISQFLSPLSPSRSAFHSVCCSVSITFHLLIQACSSLSLSLPLSVRGHHCNRPPPSNFLLKSQHPVYLCTWHAALYLAPLSGLSLPERLTIPSASPLIYHPNTRGEKNNNLLREKQPQKGKGNVWIATVDRVTGFIYVTLVAHHNSCDSHLQRSDTEHPQTQTLKTQLWYCELSSAYSCILQTETDEVWWWMD